MGQQGPPCRRRYRACERSGVPFGLRKYRHRTDNGRDGSRFTLAALLTVHVPTCPGISTFSPPAWRSRRP